MQKVECVGKSEKETIVSEKQLSVRHPTVKSKKGGKCGHLCFFAKEKNEERSLSVREGEFGRAG
jgi:hypothetical protein